MIRSLTKFGFAGLALLAFVGTASAATKTAAGKLFVANAKGTAILNNGEKIEPLNEKAIFPAQGVIVETKDDGSSVIVFSNSMGVQFGAQTRFEVKRFTQEPFAPNRSEADVEPSISEMSISLSRGSVAVCTPRMVAGSVLNYTTPHAVVAVRGRKVLIETTESCTKISLLEGDVTVRGGGEIDMGGHVLKPGQQAVVPGSAVGVAAPVAIRSIPSAEVEGFQKRMVAACMARSTVFFDVGTESEVAEIIAVPTTPTETPSNTVSNSQIP